MTGSAEPEARPGPDFTGRGVGLAHFTVLEVPPLELVSLAARIGYAAVGLRLYPAFPGAPFYEAKPGTAASRNLRRRIHDEGVGVYDIEFVTMGPDFDPAELEPILHAAAELGARRLSVCGDDPDRSRLAARLAKLCDGAAQYDMAIDVEWMAWRAVATLQDTLALVQAADRSNCGLLIDALHLNRTGGGAADVAALSPDLVRSVQLCDAPAHRPTTQETMIQEARSGRLPPGEGALPLLDLLSAAPSGAVLSVEVPMAAGSPPEDRAARIFTATRSLLALAQVRSEDRP